MIRVNGKNEPWHEGMTVEDLLEALDDPYPYAAVRVGNRVVSKPNFKTYTIDDNSEVFLIPLISGG